MKPPRSPRAVPFLLLLLAAIACGDDAQAPSAGQPGPVTLADGRVCYEDVLYLDADGDGVGVADSPLQVCLSEGEERAGYARAAGDCAPDDPRVFAGADEVCGDNLDDNCDPADEPCPESVSIALRRPDWDCTGEPPSQVIAWAAFADNEYYEPGACFVFFEGLPDEFYVEPVGLNPAPEKVMAGPMGACEAVEGCICPSIENWSYDRGRLYALTLRGDPDDCDSIVVRSQAGSEQVVSNGCRKYLYQIWFNPNEFSFVSASEAELRRRLTEFPRIEIACFEGQPFDDLPFASLLTAEIRWNERFSSR